MKRFAQTVLLKDDPQIIDEYERYHANIWPEVVKGSYKSGIRRTFIYRFGRQLFMFLETVDDFDWELDAPKYMENNPKAVEWDNMMADFQEPVPGAPTGSKWVRMDEIFALEPDTDPKFKGIAEESKLELKQEGEL